VSIDDELPPSYRTVTPGSIAGSHPDPKDRGGVSPKVGKSSEQIRDFSSERQHRPRGDVPYGSGGSRRAPAHAVQHGWNVGPRA